MTASPFEILGLPADADDARIRRAYLEQVRRHPPERDPERFRAIQRAYEQIKDARRRIAYQLFYVPEPEEIAARLPPRRPSLERFRALLEACAREEGDG